MYAPPQFREDRPEVLAEAIRAIRLAAVVATGPDGLTAAHLPALLRDREGCATLEAHVARGNPIWRAEGPALAIFQGPHAYVHPGWYATKRETGKVVPTWNYVAVHVHGTLAAVEDGAWLARHLDELTERHEAGRAGPWSVSDAPPDYIGALKRGIVGLSLRVERIEGVWKMIQHHPEANRAGVIAGLGGSADPADRAAAAVMRGLEDARRG